MNGWKFRLGLLRRRRLKWGAESFGEDGLGGRAVRLGWARGVDERCGSDRLWKLPLRKMPWESAEVPTKDETSETIVQNLVRFIGFRVPCRTKLTYFCA